jgi:DNA-binding CsgD family transcriptional regulator/PAS domain-containing protein
MVRSRERRVGKDAVFEGPPLLSGSNPGAERPSAFLKSLCSRMKGASAFFLLQDLRDLQTSVETTVCWRPNVGLRKTVARNLWLIRCELILAAGATDSCGVCAEQDLQSTEYVAGEVLKGASLLQPDLRGGNSFSRLTVLRPKGSRLCPPSFVRNMRMLAQALHRELKQKGPLIELRMQAQAAADLLERIPIGIILLDTNRDVILQNKSAQHILGSAVSGRGKRNTLPLDLIWSALDDGFLTKRPCGDCFCLFQPAVRQRSCVFAYPVARGSYIGVHKPATALLLTDQGRSAVLSGSELMQCYGVTRAEARLTAKLLQNHSLAECARLLGISVNTARNQLKRIFDKTGTRRQAELLNLLLSAPPARPPDEGR